MRSFDRGFAVVVGIKSYEYVGALRNAVLRDASELAEVLRDPDRCAYPIEQVRHLRDRLATADAVRRELRWLAEVTGPDDTAVFFFSGHGFRARRADGNGWANALVAVDGNPADFPAGLIEERELTELLRGIRAGRLLVILDACFAAGVGEVKDVVLDSDLVKSGFDESFFERLGHGKGRVLIASSRAEEVSYFAKDGRHSRFSHHLLEALENGVDGDTEIVGVLDLFRHLSVAVREHDPSQPQHPVLKAEVEDNFAIAMAPRRSQADLERDRSSKSSVNGPEHKRSSDSGSGSNIGVQNNNSNIGVQNNTTNNTGPQIGSISGGANFNFG